MENKDRVAPATVAFFDLDNTIVQKNIFRVFLKFGREERLFPTSSVINLVVWKVVSVLTGRKKYVRQAMMRMVNGLRIDEFYERWEQFVEKRLDGFTYRSALDRIARHRTKGEPLVMITNNIDFVVRPLASRLGFGEIICFATERNGMGRVLTRSKWSKDIAIEKREAVLRYARDKSVDLAQSYGYGDSTEDYDFLNAVGNPFLILKEDRCVHFVPKVHRSANPKVQPLPARGGPKCQQYSKE